MNLTAILFDMDGTLADTIPVCIQAYQVTVQHFCGRTPEVAEIYAHFGPSEEGILEQFIPGRLEETLPFFLAHYERCHTSCAQPFSGVARLFSVLKAKKMRSAIVTGKGLHSAEISMRVLGLSQWVDMLEAGSASGAIKPHSMRQVLQRWGIPPEQAAYVGDTPYDISAAREAGLLPVGAAWAADSLLRSQPVTGDCPIFYEMDRFSDWIEQS
jgi:pyrophosphatase PpaX